MNNKKKGRKIKFIVSLISVGIFAYSYFVVSNGYMNKTSQAYKEVESVKLQIKERKAMLAQEEEILNSLEEVNELKLEIMNSYPVHIAKEDNFMFIKEMQDSLRINVSSINVSDNTGFYKTILPAVVDNEIIENQDDTAPSDNNSDSKAEPATMNGVVNTISLNFLSSYEGFKELAEYIRNYPEPTVIDNVSVNYDSSTAALVGNLTIKRFALTGTGKEYKVKPIEDIEIGTDNIFGTGTTIEEDDAPINETDSN